MRIADFEFAASAAPFSRPRVWDEFFPPPGGGHLGRMPGARLFCLGGVRQVRLEKGVVSEFEGEQRVED